MEAFINWENKNKTVKIRMKGGGVLQRHESLTVRPFIGIKIKTDG